MATLFDLDNKLALITGSGKGIGFSMAKALGKAGATIILNGRNAETLKQAQSKLKERSIDSYAYAFDITNSKQIERNISSIEKDLGPIDILVNNAGAQIRHPLEEFPEKDWDIIVDTNLKGAYLMAKTVSKGMIIRNSGKIINICSIQSELSRATITPYVASKGGLKMLTKGMATEWGRYNIQVNGIGPGYMKTDMTKPLWQNKEFDSWVCSRTPAQRWGDPEELAGPLIFLASSASTFVNGHILYVDGGITSCL